MKPRWSASELDAWNTAQADARRRLIEELGAQAGALAVEAYTWRKGETEGAAMARVDACMARMRPDEWNRARDIMTPVVEMGLRFNRRVGIE